MEYDPEEKDIVINKNGIENIVNYLGGIGEINPISKNGFDFGRLKEEVYFREFGGYCDWFLGVDYKLKKIIIAPTEYKIRELVPVLYKEFFEYDLKTTF